MKKFKLATVLLGDHPGSHTSCLDLNEWLLNQSAQVELVCSSLTDSQEYPQGVHIALVEGTVTNQDNLLLLEQVRERSKIVISFGDCAAIDNNALHDLIDETESIFQIDNSKAAKIQNQIPQKSETLSKTLKQLLRVHEIVDVDVYLTDCPPNAKQVMAIVEMFLAGEVPQLSGKLDEFG